MHFSVSPPERQGACGVWGVGWEGRQEGWWLLIHQLGFSKILKVHALSSMNFKLHNLSPQGNPDFTILSPFLKFFSYHHPRFVTNNQPCWSSWRI